MHAQFNKLVHTFCDNLWKCHWSYPVEHVLLWHCDFTIITSSQMT